MSKIFHKKPKVINTSKLALFVLFLTAFASSAAVLDGMAAAVDEEIILESDISEEMINAARELGQMLPSDPKELSALHDQTLQMLIDRKVMLVKADEEKIVVSDAEVNDELIGMMNTIEKSYGGKDAMEKYLSSQGATYKAIENTLRRRLKEKQKIKLLLDKVLGLKIRITEDEIRDFYDKNRDQLELPEMVNLSEVVISKKPSEHTEQSILLNMQQIQRKVESGVSFEDMVRKYSEAEDAASGGLLEIVRGKIADADFEKAIFALKNAEISTPLLTSSGYELVKMLDLNGDTAKIRHLLLLVKPSAADVAEARARAQLAYDRLKAGEDFGKVAMDMSDDPDVKVTGGKVEEVELSNLEQALPAMATAIKNMSVGELSQVIDDARAFFVIKLDRRAQGRELTLDEARTHIQSYLKNTELEKESKTWVAQLRSRYYIRLF